jgi:signal transduction histidine kinase
MKKRARHLAIDLVAIAVAALVALVTAGEVEQSGRVTGRALFWALVLAGIGCVALLWRRSHPIGVAVLVAAISAVTELVGGAALIAVYTVAANRGRQVTITMAALYLLISVPYSIIRPDPELGVVGVNAVNVALLAVTVMLGTAVRARRELVASLRERAARAEAEAGLRAERQRSLERERIAREMHDMLAHRISLVSLHAGALEIRPDLSAEEVARAAGTIRASAHQALEELREILGVLNPHPDGGSLRPQPALADLAELIEESKSTGTPLDVDDRLDGKQAPPSVSRTAYRLVQEGLTNARKHAPGEQVHLLLERTGAGELHVWLHNRLATTPGPAIPGARSGLVGLVERVSLAGGRVDHGARRGAGGEVSFHLEAWLPWPT